MKKKQNTTPVACVVLAAGKGTRMKSSMPKVMHRLTGKPLIAHVSGSLKALNPAILVTVIAPGMDSVEQAVRAEYAQAKFAVQEQQNGTGHAVRMAQAALEGFEGNVLIAYGDTPLVKTETFARLLAVLEEYPKCSLATLGMRMDDPTGYGRLVVNEQGQLERIVECKDANPWEKAIKLCNSGVMAVRGPVLFNLLRQIQNRNVSGEYYLTDSVGIAREQGLECRAVEALDAQELQGINSRAQLAEAEQFMQNRLRRAAMDSGVTLIDPASVFFSIDTQIGQDTVVHPFVNFGPGVRIGSNVEIRSFSHLEEASVADHATIGPYARLRPGAVLEEGAHIGNFVEIKKSTIAKGAKVNHLTYIGDAEVGEGANVGAGTITCNYDGYAKHKTVIGAGAFIGSNTSLVAPVKIGEGAITGAGSVITQDVPAHALAVERSDQSIREGAAQRIREIRGKKKSL